MPFENVKIVPQARDFVDKVLQNKEAGISDGIYGHASRGLVHGLFSEASRGTDEEVATKQITLLREQLPRLLEKFGPAFLTYLEKDLGLPVDQIIKKLP